MVELRERIHVFLKHIKVQQKTIMNGDNEETVCATVAGGSLARAPEELNFAFIGKLYVYDDVDQYVCDNVVIGQGHSGANNNWWIYSNFWPMNADGTPQKSGYANRLMCEGEGGKLQFSVESSTFSPNTFILKEI